MIQLILSFLLGIQSSYATVSYSPRGIGGGGALAAYSISPYSGLRLVGTDMGTLFRSSDQGKTWTAISHAQARFDSDLTKVTEIGFSSDKKTLFYSEGGKNPKRSLDEGVTWHGMNLSLDENERILYFIGSPSQSSLILCGTTDALYQSTNLGASWTKIKTLEGRSAGSAFLDIDSKPVIFHATENQLWISKDSGKTFQKWATPSGVRIRSFAGGADSRGVTLALSDSDGENACGWAKRAGNSTDEQKKNTFEECGFVWTQKFKALSQSKPFEKLKKEAGRFVRMALNDSQTIYVTGGNWVRQYGSKVWISKNAGTSWNLVMQVYDWDQHPYQPWPKDRLEYSAVGVDVGWDDNAPTSFSVNLKNSAEIGGTGYYFLHASQDFGEHWRSPFTQFADAGPRTKGKKWKSTGLEVTSVLKLKFHPKNSKVGYASVADIGGLITEDGGQTFRISKAKYNTNYDYAFDPSKPDLAYVASGSRHDFPLNINTPLHEQGGIFMTENRGKSWKRLTPENESFNRQFLSVAYDPTRKILYGGTQGGGVARSKDGGKRWEWINSGFPSGDQVIPQIEIDPRDGTAYALLTGNAPEFKNADETGIYKLAVNTAEWKLMRKTVVRPKGVDQSAKLWQFPSSFAIDYSNKDRSVMWLTDIENKGAWLATGAWKTSDKGNTWTRATQFTHPTSVVLDEKNPKRVIVAGLYDVTGKWGKGGGLISNDGGVTFLKNDQLPLLANLFNVTPDPARPENGFFQFFGGGMLYGPLTGRR